MLQRIRSGIWLSYHTQRHTFGCWTTCLCMASPSCIHARREQSCGSGCEERCGRARETQRDGSSACISDAMGSCRMQAHMIGESPGPKTLPSASRASCCLPPSVTPEAPGSQGIPGYVAICMPLRRLPWTAAMACPAPEAVCVLIGIHDA